ncbi:MAG: PEP-utilizing enzyme [Syntrophorhabdales bacterium]|jgi:pyruvate,water dikinase
MISNVAVSMTPEVEEKPNGKRTNVRGRLQGLGASAGVAEGPCRVISRVEDLRTVKQDEILVFRTASPEIVPFMGRLAAIVTEVGGRLATAPNYARKLGVPCVTAVRGAMEAIHDGQVIRVDGSRGTVHLIS